MNAYCYALMLIFPYKHEGRAYLDHLIIPLFIFLILLSWTSPSEQTTSAKKIEDKVSKAVEVFVGRIQKMENDFIRYEMANDCHGSLWHMILTFLNITALMHSCLRSLFYYIPLTAWNF